MDKRDILNNNNILNNILNNNHFFNIFNTFNGMNFPYLLKYNDDKYKLYKYKLDNLYGDINLSETVQEVIWEGDVLDIKYINNIIKKESRN